MGTNLSNFRDGSGESPIVEQDIKLMRRDMSRI